jgi:hypothetical protein
MSYLYNTSGAVIASAPASSIWAYDTDGWIVDTPSGYNIAGGLLSGQSGAPPSSLIYDTSQNAPGNNNATSYWSFQGVGDQLMQSYQNTQQWAGPYLNQLQNDYLNLTTGP